MKFGRKFGSRLLGLGAGLTVLLGVAAGTATSASANGTNGTYQLCSRGTYASYISYAEHPGPPESYVASPGQCVPIHMDGTRVDIYGLYPGGSSFFVGSDWYQANIATTGDMGPGDYSWYVY